MRVKGCRQASVVRARAERGDSPHQADAWVAKMVCACQLCVCALCVQVKVCVNLHQPAGRYFGKFLSLGQQGKFRKIFPETCLEFLSSIPVPQTLQPKCRHISGDLTNVINI